jgi:antirestriction protein ArdC
MAEFRTPQRDHYADVTAKIIAALEAGTPPWRRPWDPNKVPGGGPRNGVSGHRYRGINTLLLGMTPEMFTSGDPRWLSYKQSAEKGWQVRKGEKATTIFFFKKVQLRESGDGASDELKTVPVLRSYAVFHASQVEGISAYTPPSAVEVPWRTPESASVIVTRSGVVLREGGERAFYSPSTDYIQMPPRVAFKSPQGWASTILHELGHNAATRIMPHGVLALC